MSSCEKCWSESRMHDNYHELIKKIPGCTPEEQAGPFATVCPKCKRKTLHQMTRQCIIAKLKELHMNDAHYIDVVVRTNGVSVHYEANWLKDLLIYLEH